MMAQDPRWARFQTPGPVQTAASQPASAQLALQQAQPVPSRSVPSNGIGKRSLCNNGNHGLDESWQAGILPYGPATAPDFHSVNDMYDPDLANSDPPLPCGSPGNGNSQLGYVDVHSVKQGNGNHGRTGDDGRTCDSRHDRPLLASPSLCAACGCGDRGRGPIGQASPPGLVREPMELPPEGALSEVQHWFRDSPGGGFSGRATPSTGGEV